MIASYANADTEKVALGFRVKKFEAVVLQAQRRLALLRAATSLKDLKIPPGNRLEALSGDREGQHTIRINDQYRICFEWRDTYAYKVEIVDDHG